MRIRANFVQGVVADAPLTSSATTLNAQGLADLPVVSGGDIAVLVIDPDQVDGAREIVYVTDHGNGAVFATIQRGRESTAAVEHPQGTAWIHAPTVLDWNAGLIDATNNIQEMVEVSDTTTPGSNKLRFFARDNGVGLTQLCVKFPSGNIVVVAEDFL